MPAERGSQFPDIKHEVLDGGDGVPEIRRISRGSAYIEYEHDPEVKQTNIGYLKSSDEGKGHAQALLHHLYAKYPTHTIHWGNVIHPAAAHLMEKMSKTYGRTRGEVNLDEDYGYEMGRED
jgi:hypothetical protein